MGYLMLSILLVLLVGTFGSWCYELGVKATEQRWNNAVRLMADRENIERSYTLSRGGHHR